MITTVAKSKGKIKMWHRWRFISAVLKVIFRHPVAGVTIVPILPNGDMVLVFRQDTHQWSLPGGMIDWGEDIPHTLKRELREETGLNLVKIRDLIGVYSAPKRDPRLHSISILISADVDSTMNIEDTLEISQVKAFSPDSLPLGNLAHDHDRQIQDFLQGKSAIA